MAVKDVSGTQGSFVSRTKSLDIQHPGGVTGLVVGQVYNIALKKVVNGSSTVVQLLQ